MTEYVITLLAAAAVTYILTPMVRRFAIAVGAIHAARERDVHKMPTPLLGGFAIYGGLAAALLLASRLSGLSSVFTDTNMAKGLLLAGGLVVIMGFVDDRWGMGALSKLAGQVAAGVILVWSGAEIPWLPAPGGVTLILTSDQQVAVTILVVVVTMNAVNFIDGLDGLAAGIVGIGAIAFFAYYFTLVHRLGLPDQTEPALVSVLLAGVCIGFLPHNFYPARIFMGDTGSMLIGLMLAYAPISSLALLAPASLTDPTAYAAGTVNRYGAFIPLLVPAAILLIPYADLLMAVVRRTRAGTSVFAPDKKHLQHRLLAIGHSHRTSVLIMYLWAALFSGTVIWLSIVRTPLFVLAIVTVAAVLCLLLVTMPRLRPWSRAAVGDEAADRLAPRPAGASAARPAAVTAVAPPAETAPAGTAPAGAAPASAAPERRARARPAAAGTSTQDRRAADTQAPDRPAVRSPAPAGAASRGNGGAATGGGPAGNGAAAGPGTPATAGPGDAAGPDARARKAAEAAPYRDAGPGIPHRDAGPGVPPWEAGPAVPHRDAGPAVPPWEVGPGIPHRDAGPGVPPWEAGPAVPHRDTRPAVPPWEVGPAVPHRDARPTVPHRDARPAVPPWEAEGAAPSPGAPPWPPAVRPQPPAVPPRPPAPPWP